MCLRANSAVGCKPDNGRTRNAKPGHHRNPDFPVGKRFLKSVVNYFNRLLKPAGKWISQRYMMFQSGKTLPS
jgi:hypothetical protein